MKRQTGELRRKGPQVNIDELLESAQSGNATNHKRATHSVNNPASHVFADSLTK